MNVDDAQNEGWRESKHKHKLKNVGKIQQRIDKVLEMSPSDSRFRINFVSRLLE